MKNMQTAKFICEQLGIPKTRGMNVAAAMREAGLVAPGLPGSNAPDMNAQQAAMFLIPLAGGSSIVGAPEFYRDRANLLPENFMRESKLRSDYPTLIEMLTYILDIDKWDIYGRDVTEIVFLCDEPRVEIRRDFNGQITNTRYIPTSPRANDCFPAYYRTANVAQSVLHEIAIAIPRRCVKQNHR